MQNQFGGPVHLSIGGGGGKESLNLEIHRRRLSCQQQHISTDCREVESWLLIEITQAVNIIFLVQFLKHIC